MNHFFALCDLLTSTARRRLVWQTLNWGVLAWLWVWIGVFVHAAYVR